MHHKINKLLMYFCMCAGADTHNDSIIIMIIAIKL